MCSSYYICCGDYRKETSALDNKAEHKTEKSNRVDDYDDHFANLVINNFENENTQVIQSVLQKQK